MSRKLCVWLNAAGPLHVWMHSFLCLLTGLYNTCPPSLWLYCAPLSESYSMLEGGRIVQIGLHYSGHPTLYSSAVFITQQWMIYVVQTHQIAPNELYCYWLSLTPPLCKHRLTTTGLAISAKEWMVWEWVGFCAWVNRPLLLHLWMLRSVVPYPHVQKIGRLVCEHISYICLYVSVLPVPPPVNCLGGVRWCGGISVLAHTCIKWRIQPHSRDQRSVNILLLLLTCHGF